MSRNILLELSYLGTTFFGFQRLPGRSTVQGLLEEVLARITGETIRVFGAGRTDRGVHALGQCCNFHTESRMTPLEFQRALNSLLPGRLRVLRTAEMPEDFHARRSARGKTYSFLVWNAPLFPPFLLERAYHEEQPLDLDRMLPALSLLVGKHDFRSFAKAAHYSGGTMRHLFRAELSGAPPLFSLVFAADSFLRHMVRALAGTILEVGKGRLAPKEVSEILHGADRRLAGPTLPASGLYLLAVSYDPAFPEGQGWLSGDPPMISSFIGPGIR